MKSVANPLALRIATKYVDGLRRKAIPLSKVILFGSQARGTATGESDIDLLVVVDKMDKAIREAIIDEAYELCLQENVDIIALPCDAEEFASPLFQADTFYQNVRNDGVVIA